MIYLDSSLVTYLVEDTTARGDVVRAALAENGDERFAVSPVVRMECLDAPLRRHDLVLEDRYRAVLDLFVQLDVTVDAFERAARLRATFALRPADALHLAVAQLHGARALWTDDARLAEASHGLAHDVLAA